MWIIRPWMELTETDKHQWNELVSHRLNLDLDIPLAQRLSWGEAMSALGIPVTLIFDPEQKIGGLVFSIDEYLECVNGPLLNWHEHKGAETELREFVFHARTCLGDLSGLIIHPRWLKAEEEPLLNNLLTLPEETHYAATLIVPVQSSEETQMSHYKSRLKRSLSQNQKLNPTVTLTKLTASNVSELVTVLNSSVRENVYLPPLPWFQALVSNTMNDGTEWAWVRAAVTLENGETTETNLMVGFTSRITYFLFGGDMRSQSTPSHVSTSRIAHHAAINEARTRGCLYYDFNGFKENVNESDDYHTVNQFKLDWGGQVIAYAAPKFVF